MSHGRGGRAQALPELEAERRERVLDVRPGLRNLHGMLRFMASGRFVARRP